MTFVLIMVMVLYQIFMRYIFSIGAPWVEEVSRMLYVYLSFLGGAICLRDRQLIVIETIPELLPVKVRTVLNVVSEIFCFCVILMLFRGTIKMTSITWGSPLATVTWIDNGWMYVAGVMSFGYMILVKVVDWLSRLLGIGAHKVAEGGER